MVKIHKTKQYSIKKFASLRFKSFWLTQILLVGFIVTVLTIGGTSHGLSGSICVGVLVSFFVLCIFLAYKIVRQQAWLIWSPMPWFLLASAVYFGFGPLIYFFGNDAARQYCQSVYPVTVEDLFHVTFLNGLGVFLVFAVWFFRTKQMPSAKPRALKHDAVLRAMIFFYAVGVPVRLVTSLSNWGLVDFVMPGYVGILANFTSAGLVLLTTISLRRGGAWWFLCCAMVILDLTAAMGTFSKLPIIFSLMPCIFGYMLFRPGVRSLPWVIVYLGSVYLVSSSYAIFCYNSGLATSTLTGRANLIESYFDSDHDRVDNSLYESQAWWARLDYANVQVFAAKEYSQGRPGDSFALALIAPIPRVFWKDKPIIESGYGFYKRLTGQTSASFGMGFFAEAFWNGGWVFVILSSVAIGWLFGVVTVFIGQEQSFGNIWVLPIALLWIKGGGRVDGWIHTEIVGPGVFTLVLIGVFRYFQREIVPLPRRRHVRPLLPAARDLRKKHLRNCPDREAINDAAEII